MKLEGLRVVDLSRFLPGPVMTQFMADHGAEVVKVESVDEGEPTRRVGEQRDGVSVFFANTQRGKKSVAIDLKQPAGVEALMRLAATSDVLVESFRPGVADRLGIGYRAVAVRAPRLVYASISAFGQQGRYRDVASHDLAIEAMAGVLSITRGGDGRPAMPGIPAADILAALTALSGVLMALWRRERTGRGDFLDVAMADSLLPAMANNYGSAMAEGRQPDVANARSLGGNAMYALYETRDGAHVALGGQEPKFAANLLGLLGRPELAAVANLPPGRGQDPLRTFLRETFATRTRDEWVAFFTGRDVPFAPVRTLPEVLADPHFRERGMVTTDAHGWIHVGNPIRFADEPPRENLDVPGHGQHTRAILASLGYAEGEIRALERDGVVR